MMPAPSFQPQNYLWHPRLRCIYAIVPKAGTTSIKHWFVATVPGCPQKTSERNVHDILRETCAMDRLQPHEIAGLFADPSVFKFSFVRNPWKRLVSGYLDKVVGGEPPAHVLLRKVARRSLRGWLEWTQRRLTTGVEAIYQRGLSFREFVQALRQEPVDAIDWHFRPQSRLLADFHYDFLGRVESFDADFERLLVRLGEKIPARPQHQQKYEPLADSEWVVDWPAERLRTMPAFPHWRRFYSPDVAELVADLFADDFSQFGYSNRLESELIAA
jgi:hypothetical protein